MIHIYWAVHCKTEKCNHWLVIAYAGEFEAPVPAITLPPTSNFEYKCRACQKTYLYGYDDIKMHPMREPPPPGFQPIF